MRCRICKPILMDQLSPIKERKQPVTAGPGPLDYIAGRTQIDSHTVAPRRLFRIIWVLVGWRLRLRQEDGAGELRSKMRSLVRVTRWR